MLNKIKKLSQKKFNKSDQHNQDNNNNTNVVRSSRPTATTASPLPNGESQTPAPSPSQTPNHPMFTSAPTLEVLPLLKDVSSSDRPLLFMKKSHMCSCQCDFSDALIMPREKEIKRQTLLELVDFLHSSSGKVNETMQSELIRMVSANIFRSLPPAHYENTGAPPEGNDPEEEEPYLEPWWPHLQLVYELLLRYVVSSEIEPKTAKIFINHTFVSRLLDLFDSEDPREREYLKTVLHRIYGKFIFHRPFIRCSVYNIFYKFLYETERCIGIGELLEIIASVINGFTVPMREEHRLFLVKAVLPLHKSKSISVYHQQLSYCVTLFVEKDYKLADTVIRGLLKYWPLTNCNKEVLYLGELEEVLDVTEPSEFQHCVVPLFTQIGKCLNSSHFQVAERALFLWNNEHIVGLIAENKDVIFPIIFEALERNMKGHWNQAVHGLSENVRRMFMEMDNDLFEECEKHYQENEAKTWELLEQREMTWKRLEEAASLAAN
ncbi:Serine/threonine protein phosphatase 2A 57 kDa regulatory subunit B' epsilon isoform [Raphanus sativus]|uniref:Serine/threonine protein phosphatase 2A regulatory subunit n=1 Tax=Raphanus sativus TaxID=3726 RepID=A0A6J0P8W7_RAPSA|nr:serine/threonine protein phosphatase 2A 57 kDa regulatory subunit B' epsilon isoform [Raphanus sativus]KAJ4895855.1 Serine/threonine protein phosphatase 2A 57 kDa regulatory subunit B' epsilon isoform [Raphanus sativus]